MFIFLAFDVFFAESTEEKDRIFEVFIGGDVGNGGGVDFQRMHLLHAETSSINLL